MSREVIQVMVDGGERCDEERSECFGEWERKGKVERVNYRCTSAGPCAGDDRLTNHRRLSMC